MPETRKKYLRAEKDFEAGDVIYMEDPVVAALDKDLQEEGAYCTHCLRLVHKATAIKAEEDPINATYCSKECQLASTAESQNFLFGTQPILPPEMDNGMSQLTKPRRMQAQKAFTEYIKSQEGNAPLLLARFVARQIGIETAKILGSRASSTVATLPELTEQGGDYGIADHLERLRYVDTSVDDKHHDLYTELFAATLPGLEQSLPKDKHPVNLGKIAYNAYGICYSGGRDDKPASTARPEEQEYTRTPYGTSRQIGSGLYVVSSYLSHSCDPNTKPTFSSGTSQLHLVALRPIKQGEELNVSYVDVTQREGETVEEARRRRRYDLARGWRFKCECPRCLAEIEAASEAEKEEKLDVETDESKIESVVERVERGEAGMVPDTD
ncbi:hypothetical protein EIP86_010140 [Pleurotus ostreatoroseus]|nr:hypothetical protein EIP86_010140 [Pleurotus ostreatoroseus]